MLHCTLIRGVMVIHPGLKYELFHYTMVHFDHILSGVQISTIADFRFYAQWWLLSIITNFKFCMNFFMLSWFNLKYFWELVKIAIIAVFCKITCRIWILIHGMNTAISFLVFFHTFIITVYFSLSYQLTLKYDYHII